MDLKWPEMPSEVNFGHPKWPINLKWPEMRSKMIFRHPKWPPEKKILYRSEMARIAIESEFRKSKMADRSAMARNRKWISDIQNSRRQPFCQKISPKNYGCISIWNGQKCDWKWISDIQNGWRQPFCQKFQNKFKLRIDLKWPEMRSKSNSDIQNVRRQPFCQKFQKKLKLHIDVKWI